MCEIRHALGRFLIFVSRCTICICYDCKSSSAYFWLCYLRHYCCNLIISRYRWTFRKLWRHSLRNAVTDHVILWRYYYMVLFYFNRSTVGMTGVLHTEFHRPTWNNVIILYIVVRCVRDRKPNSVPYSLLSFYPLLILCL